MNNERTPMKMIGIEVATMIMTATGALFLPGTEAFAARENDFRGEGEYVVPVADPTLLPYSRFLLNEVRVSKNDDGLYEMEIELPYDLTGGERVRIELLEQFSDATTIILVNPDGNGFAECKGATWATAKCRYEFEGLKAKFAAKLADGSLKEYVGAKYRNDAHRAKREAVAVTFGAEPIGELVLGALDSGCPGCSIGNGEWESEYTTASGSLVAAPLSLARRTGVYYNESGSGTLSDLVYQGNVATGRWSYGGQSGWLRFTFEDDGNAFTGNWGLANVGTPAKGTWSGFRR